MDGNLTGDYFVRAGKAALHDARKLLPKTKDFATLRRHALKLRFWPEQHPESENGQVLDLDWSWIKAIPSSHIGELRIRETIANFDNLRIIFFVPREKKKIPCIWVLAAFQKKRDDFTHAQIINFKARQKLILERFYKNP